MVPAVAEWVYFQVTWTALSLSLVWAMAAPVSNAESTIGALPGKPPQRGPEQVVISPGTPSFSSVASHVQWFLSAFTVRSLLQTLVLSCLTTTLLLVSDFMSDAKVMSKQVNCFFFSC